MKRVGVLLIFLILLFSFNFVSAQIGENAEKELTYDLEKSQDLTQFYSSGRFLLGFLSFFKGGTCGNNVCETYEFSCFEDCGKLVAKNGFFGGDTYTGKSSYKDVEYSFQVYGECTGLSSSEFLRDKDRKGAIMRNMEVNIKYEGKEEFFEVEDKQDFTLENGVTFYVNSQMCELLGFVDIGISNSVCGDMACWSPLESNCPDDCEFFWVKFYKDDEDFFPLENNLNYDGYNYDFNVLSVENYCEEYQVGNKKVNLQISYAPIDNPSLITTEEHLIEGEEVDRDFELNGVRYFVSLPCRAEQNIFILSFKKILKIVCGDGICGQLEDHHSVQDEPLCPLDCDGEFYVKFDSYMNGTWKHSISPLVSGGYPVCPNPGGGDYSIQEIIFGDSEINNEINHNGYTYKFRVIQANAELARLELEDRPCEKSYDMNSIQDLTISVEYFPINDPLSKISKIIFLERQGKEDLSFVLNEVKFDVSMPPDTFIYKAKLTPQKVVIPEESTYALSFQIRV